MTQATDTTEVLNQLGKLITVVESIQTDVQDIKVNQARTDERLKALETQMSDFKKSTDTQFADIKNSTDTQFADIKKSTDTQFTDIRTQLRSQDNRLWTFLAALFLAVLGFAAKLILFPSGQM